MKDARMHGSRSEFRRSPRHLLASLGLLMLTLSSLSQAQNVSEILNYREYTPLFSSAGQPTREQLPSIKAAGYDRVIYIAFSNGRTAIPEEDQLVKDLGMDYLHIPVDFNNPTLRDFNAFADAMQREPESRTLLHCQVNARATAFSFLYRVIYQGADMKAAKADMNTVWQPNAVWRDFIFAVLNDHGISPDCEGCDWTPPAPQAQ
ncbi:MAG: protein tyrosine phosphatase family protein [Pseudomonadales bacterium]|nr:protein tyrosine phosphatase family protein [Pseudomonadales bacterium]MCP5357281.1 protein tyrosine phosphatase family protein [Pseudomonadales bacterium]